MKKIAILSVSIYILILIVSFFFPEERLNYSTTNSNDGLKVDGEVIFESGRVIFFDKRIAFIERVHKIKAPNLDYFDSRQVIKNKWYEEDYSIRLNWLGLPAGLITVFLTLYIFSKLLTFGKSDDEVVAKGHE